MLVQLNEIIGGKKSEKNFKGLIAEQKTYATLVGSAGRVVGFGYLAGP
jgi:hypothetical protein